jgi:hypothetical protein
MIDKLLRAIRNAPAVIVMALFVALMRYVLYSMVKSQSQRGSVDVRPEDTPADEREQVRRPALLS